MILNSFSVITGFFCLLRVGLAAALVGMAFIAWRSSTRYASRGELAFQPDVDASSQRESGGYLLFQTALTLFVLCFAGWPLFYALLQSYVPQWEGVMCIYGVTRIGADASGPSGWLPGLLVALQVNKPAIVFVGGACFAIYIVQRRFRPIASMRSVFVGLAAFGLLACADSSLEAAYLVIPKREPLLASGCCTSSADGMDSTATRETAPMSPALRHWISWAHFGLCAVLIGVCGRAALLARRGAHFSDRGARFGLAVAFFGALASLPLGWLFLYEVAAPTILGLPFHRCPYDLLPQAPESVTAILAHLLAAFFIGWAVVAQWASGSAIGGSEQAASTSGDALAARSEAASVVRRLLFLAAAGYSIAVLVMALEIWLAI